MLESPSIKRRPSANLTPDANRSLRGGRLIKTSLGIASLAPMMLVGGAVLLVGASMSRAEADVSLLESNICPPNTVETAVSCGLGSINADENYYSYAWGVSGDGSLIVGDIGIGQTQPRGFTWTATAGMVDIGTLNGVGQSSADLVSTDGTTVVGASSSTFQGVSHAYRWSKADGMQDLILDDSVFDSTKKSKAYGVSSDGSVIVGQAVASDGYEHAFRWTQAGIRDLGTMKGETGTSVARGVSSDGSTVVGQSVVDSASRAFRWQDGSMLDLGSLRTTDAYGYSQALATNADGSTVVGWAHNNDYKETAFRWTEADGMQSLGTLAEFDAGVSKAQFVSDDGTVIAGYASADPISDEGNNKQAFIWTNGLMTDLGSARTDGKGESSVKGLSGDGSAVMFSGENSNSDMRTFLATTTGTVVEIQSLKSDGTGVVEGYGLSKDGTTAVGMAENDNGDQHAFIWRSGSTQDSGNLTLSFGNLASDTEVAVADQQFAARQLLDSTCIAQTAGATCVTVGGNVASLGNASNLGTGSTGGMISLGRGLDDTTTIGATIAVSAMTQQNSGFDGASGVGLGVWGQYSASGSGRTGLQAGVALGYMTQSADIIRGNGLENVDSATAAADMATRTARFDLGYGMKLSDSWLITPNAGLSMVQTSRSAYAEDPTAAFSASYDKLSLQSTVATFGITGDLTLNETSRLLISGGIDFDLGADRVQLAGTSTVSSLEVLDITSTLSRNNTRPFVSVAYAMDIEQGGTVTTRAGLATPLFGSDPQLDLGVSYGIKF
jgi:probable HAF family extracellular repeat protein